MSSEDIFSELNELFAQVDPSVWYPLLKKETFQTWVLTLSKEETQALYDLNSKIQQEFQQWESQPLSSQESGSFQSTLLPSWRQNKVLVQLAERLDTEIVSHQPMQNSTESSRSSSSQPRQPVFVKFADRSPKDSFLLAGKMDALMKRPNRFFQYSNANLQNYIFAKCHSLAVYTGREALELFLTSERSHAEMEMKIIAADQSLQVQIREFMQDFDPAFEFRAFVSNGKLTGLSQMATFDALLHYPQVKQMRQTIESSVQEYFLKQLAAPLQVITNRGPAKQVVIDLFYHVAASKWYVVELNPFQTSSSGHCFKYWGEDMDRLLHGPFQFRFRDTTPSQDLWEVIPRQHHTYLKAPTQIYDVTEAQFVNCDLSNEIDHQPDIKLKISSHYFAAHSNVTASRLPSIANLIGNGLSSMPNANLNSNSSDQLPEIQISKAEISDRDIKELMLLVYCGKDGSKNWKPHDWNSLFMLSLELKVSELNEMLINWRENQGRSQSNKLYGKEENYILPGWRSRAEKSNANCLTFSFEIEGNSPRITDFFAPENIAEKEWLEMQYRERMKIIGRNWSKLKRKLTTIPTPYWMNQNLTIEDNGFLWEVNYGGDSAGYCMDIEHVFSELWGAIDMGLSSGDRGMDSGIQMHIAFPFMQEESRPIREQVLATMIYLDDYIFLHEWTFAMIDDCNNMWTTEDVAKLWERLDDMSEMQKWVSNGTPSAPFPSFRGRDTYGVDNRFGIEVRRAGTTEHIERMARKIINILSRIGKEPSDTLTIQVGHNPRLCPYPISLVVKWILSRSRVCPETFAGPVDMDKLDNLGEVFAEGIFQWEDHLKYSKRMIWSKDTAHTFRVVAPPDQQTHKQSIAKIRRRLLFLLQSDFRQLPGLVNATDSSSFAKIVADEQTLFLQDLDNLMPLSEKQKLRSELGGLSLFEASQVPEKKSAASRLAFDNTLVRELAVKLQDFVNRLTNYY